MKRKTYFILINLLFVFCGCSFFSNNGQLSEPPVLIISPAELSTSLSGQKIFLYSTRDLYSTSGDRNYITSLDRSFEMPLNIDGNDFRLSQDSKFLTYTVSKENLDIEVHLLNLMTAEDQVLFETKDIPFEVKELGISNPSLSPDGKNIIFRYTVSDVEFGLGLFSLETKTIRTITQEGFNSEPEITVNGDKILSICEGKEAVGFQICIMESDGTNRQRLTDEPGGHDAWLSPDGEHIVYQYTTRSTLFQSGTENLYVMDLNGAGITELVKGDTHFLTFSKDGKDVVFCPFREKENICEGIFVIGLDGLNLRELTYFDEEFLSKWK